MAKEKMGAKKGMKADTKKGKMEAKDAKGKGGMEKMKGKSCK